jgi:membrane fusion protein (multidrug efflux system)
VEVAEAALRDAVLAQRTQVQLTEAAVLAAKASIIQADLNLGYTTIASLINGIIGKIQVDPGNLVGKNEPTLLATISAVDPIYVEFPVAEADYLKLSARLKLDEQGRGQEKERRLELYLADDSLFPQKGRLIFVGRAFDVKTGTIPVQAEFPNPEKARPGQSPASVVWWITGRRVSCRSWPCGQRGPDHSWWTRGQVAFRPVTLDERVGVSTS